MIFVSIIPQVRMLGWAGIWVRRLPDAWVMLDEVCLWIRMQRMVVVGIATEAAHGFSGTSMSRPMAEEHQNDPK